MLYYLSLGSNLGEREQTLRQAVEQIGQQVGSVLRCSTFYYSEPWGFASEHPFCNLCCAVETTLLPLDVLSATQTIEHALGRTRKSVGGAYCDRSIDIDLIQAYDDAGHELIVQTPTLTLPHPLWTQREFVRVPLEEIK